MIDKQKVIIMSKLAAYDKYHAHKDRKKAEYFRHDYVYKRNIGVRFTALIGSLIVILFYFAHRIIIEKIDVFDITGEIMTDIIKAIVFIIAVQFIYSMIGFLIFSKEYNDSQDRINDYFDNLNRLQRRSYILEQRRLKKLREMRRGKEESGSGYERDDERNTVD